MLICHLNDTVTPNIVLFPDFNNQPSNVIITDPSYLSKANKIGLKDKIPEQGCISKSVAPYLVNSHKFNCAYKLLNTLSPTVHESNDDKSLIFKLSPVFQTVYNNVPIICIINNKITPFIDKMIQIGLLLLS